MVPQARTMRWASLRNSSATSVEGVRAVGGGMEQACLLDRIEFSVGVRSVMLLLDGTAMWSVGTMASGE